MGCAISEPRVGARDKNPETLWGSVAFGFLSIYDV